MDKMTKSFSRSKLNKRKILNRTNLTTITNNNNKQNDIIEIKEKCYPYTNINYLSIPYNNNNNNNRYQCKECIQFHPIYPWVVTAFNNINNIHIGEVNFYCNVYSAKYNGHCKKDTASYSV